MFAPANFPYALLYTSMINNLLLRSMAYFVIGATKFVITPSRIVRLSVIIVIVSVRVLLLVHHLVYR